MLAILPPILALAFWLWLGVSFVILMVRLVRRLTRSGSAASGVDEAGSSPPPPTGPVPTAAWATAPPPTVMPETDPGAFGAPAPEMPTGTPATPTPHEAPPAAGPADADRGRSGVFASDPGATGGRATVVEALQGIAMPCELTPVIDGTVTIQSPFRAAFLTTTADPGTVGARLGDELERLGFTLSTMATTELLARRPGAELRVTVYPTASLAKRGLDPIFPAAPEGAVGVEFTT